MRHSNYSVIIILIILCATSCHHKEEVPTIEFKVYNLSSTGSVTISNIAVVNGFDKKGKSSYPAIINSNGGAFMTTIQSSSSSYIICDVILVVQNQGNFRIEVTNSKEEKILGIGKNRIVAEGSLSFFCRNIQWYIKTVVVGDAYNILIILNTSI